MEANVNFDYALAAGDFDCDGYDDLAIGMPGEDLVGGANAGRLVVLYSDGVALSTDDRQIWGQNSPVVEDDAEPNDRFSSVLAAGYFNADVCADLAIGVPQEDIGADSGAGAVNVLYGSSSGLTGDSDDFWDQDSALLEGSAEPADLFGAALAVGDFNDDAVAHAHPPSWASSCSSCGHDSWHACDQAVASPDSNPSEKMCGSARTSAAWAWQRP
jgi:hypothetical protein